MFNSSLKTSDLKVVLVLINQTTGEIESASSTDALVGLSKIFKDELNISVYPNPTEDKVNVSFIGIGDDCTVTIYDRSGKEVLVQSIKNAQGLIIKEVSVDHLESGSYLITVSRNETSSSKQLIIK